MALKSWLIVMKGGRKVEEGAKGASEHSRRISGLVSIKVSCA